MFNREADKLLYFFGGVLMSMKGSTAAKARAERDITESF